MDIKSNVNTKILGVSKKRRYNNLILIKDFGKLILECTEHNPDQVIMQEVKMVQLNVLDKINLAINIMKILM